ncbi:MAG: hypothetical protein J7518_10605 [Nocardioidaceae bacterium]|nr:hypothetical protein [Nocardioidaceae bacterium]
MSDVETQIAAWRAYAEKRREIGTTDTDELEDHLRDRIDELVATGLAPDEAFLVAVKRMGSLDALTREFAREHSDRLWKQLVLVDADGEKDRDLAVVLGFAALGAVLVKAPALVGVGYDDSGDLAFFARNVAVLVLAPLAAYLCWSRDASTRVCAAVAGLFGLGVVAANAYPFDPDAQVTVLTAIHLPIALWLATGVAYVGGDWRDARARMDFIRFTGEWVVYMALLALGGGVLSALVLGTFDTIGYQADEFVGEWLIPCGAAGAVVVAAWMVEAKKSVVENMAPVLGAVFAPLFALALGALVTGIVLAGGLDVERDTLILFDLLLVVVLGLLVYGISAYGPGREWSDLLRLVLVAVTLLVDVIVLIALAGRIGDYGFSANRTAALGENLVLLANLGWSALLLLRLVRGTAPVTRLERWQTSYLTVYAAWAWVVVLAFPLLFGND